jgi:hypothetical protein
MRRPPRSHSPMQMTITFAGLRCHSRDVARWHAIGNGRRTADSNAAGRSIVSTSPRPRTRTSVGASVCGRLVASTSLRRKGRKHVARLCFFSPPPCGQGSGVGVGRRGTSLPQPHDPPPRPSPTRGEGEEEAAPHAMTLPSRGGWRWRHEFRSRGPTMDEQPSCPVARPVGAAAGTPPGIRTDVATAATRAGRGAKGN